MYIILLVYALLLLLSYVFYCLKSRINIYCVSVLLLYSYFLFFYYVNTIFHFNIIVLSIYSILTMLIILFFIVFLLWNSKKLLEKEGNRITNLLSLTLALIIIILLISFPISFVIDKNYAKYLFTTYVFISLSFLYFFVLINSCFILSIIYSKFDKKNSINLFLVLGSGLINNKVPPLLGSRIDIGLNVYQNQKDVHNSIFLMSGGQGIDEQIPESLAMKKYLLQKGMECKKVLCETKSQTTYENLYFSYKIMRKNNRTSNVLICTNDFHILRAVYLAKKIGFRNFYSIGSKTKRYFFTNAFIREVIALMKMDWWVHSIVIVALFFWYIITMVNI